MPHWVFTCPSLNSWEISPMTDFDRLDALFMQMILEQHSTCCLEGAAVKDVNNMGSLTDVHRAAAIYGDAKTLARRLQICFIRGLWKHSQGGEVWARAA